MTDSTEQGLHLRTVGRDSTGGGMVWLRHLRLIAGTLLVGGLAMYALATLAPLPKFSDTIRVTDRLDRFGSLWYKEDGYEPALYVAGLTYVYFGPGQHLAGLMPNRDTVTVWGTPIANGRLKVWQLSSQGRMVIPWAETLGKIRDDRRASGTFGLVLAVVGLALGMVRRLVARSNGP